MTRQRKIGSNLEIFWLTLCLRQLTSFCIQRSVFLLCSQCLLNDLLTVDFCQRASVPPSPPSEDPQGASAEAFQDMVWFCPSERAWFVLLTSVGFVGIAPWPITLLSGVSERKGKESKPRKVWESSFKYFAHTCEKEQSTAYPWPLFKTRGGGGTTSVENQLHLNVRGSSFVWSFNPMPVDANSVTLYSCLFFFFFFGYKGRRGFSFVFSSAKWFRSERTKVSAPSPWHFHLNLLFFFFLRGGKKGLVFQEKSLSTQSWNWSLDLLFLNQ